MKISLYTEGYLLLDPECKISGDIFKDMCAIPEQKKWHVRSMIVKATHLNIEYINSKWPGASWDSESEVHLQNFGNHIDKVAKLEARMSKRNTKSDFKFTREPMPHQLDAFERSKDEPVFAYLMEQGTGKTKVTCDIATHLFREGKIDAMVVVAWPNGVHANWIDYEVPEDMGCDYDSYTWSPKWAAKGEQRAMTSILISKRKILKIFSFNVESMASSGARKFIEKCLRSMRCLFVIDQSACIKNPVAKRTKFLLKMSLLAKYKRILDGDPVAEGAEEFYTQFKFLDDRIIGCSTWTAFKAEYCKLGFFREVTGYRNIDALYAKIAPFSIRVMEKDCLSIPPRSYHKFEFNLSSKEREAYRQMADTGIAEFKAESEEDDPFESAQVMHAMVKNMRLQQIASGWLAICDDESGETTSTECINGDSPSRLDAFCELIKTFKKTEKVLVFARFSADLIAIQARLGQEKCVSYHGQIADSDRKKAKDRFQTDPKTIFLAGQPKSLGIGHTLTAASHVVFYSNDHSLRFRTECEKRAHRLGQRHQLKVWDLIAKDTTDSKIVRCLRAKRSLAVEILKDPDQFFLIYED